MTAAPRTNATLRRWPLAVAILAVILTAVLLLMPLGRVGESGWQSTLLDLGHVPLFAALTFALAAVLRPWYTPTLIAVLLAGLAELVQPRFGRTGDLLDFLRSAAGALAAGAVLRGWQGSHSPARLAAHGLAALAVLVWPLASTAPRLLDAYDAWRDFPTLADFAAPRRLLRWGTRQTTLERVPSEQYPGEWDGRLEFLTAPERYASAGLEHTLRDWSGYRRVCWSFTVEGGPLTLSFSLRGAPNAQRETAHYDEERTFPPGTHRAEMELAVAAQRGSPDGLDLAQVWRSLIFVIEPKTPRTIRLHRVWLE